MRTKSIKQTATFNASPEKIYDLIMDEKKHSQFTGSEAIISTKVDGKFTVWDGYVHGHNIELERGKKIVQAWHFAEDGWPDDHLSICTFELEPAGNKTKLRFLQTNVPEQTVASISGGWKQYYWNAIKAYLKSN